MGSAAIGSTAPGERTCSGRKPIPTMRAGSAAGTESELSNLHRQRQLRIFLEREHARHDVVLHATWSFCVILVGNSRRRCTRLRSSSEGAATREGRRQNVCRRDRVLNREVDADATNGRHRVRGVADAEKARPAPFAQAVDLHGQQLDLVPVLKFADAVAQERRDAATSLAKRLQPCRAEVLDARPWR